MWQQFFPSSLRPLSSSLVYSQGSFKNDYSGLIIFQAYSFIMLYFFLILPMEKKKKKQYTYTEKLGLKSAKDFYILSILCIVAL